MTTLQRPTPGASEQGERPVKGGVVTWACFPGLPPSTIFPFTPPERIGARNLYEFQMLMYRPLYWYGTNGQPVVDDDLSLALPPEWNSDGRTVTITLKPWRWSNGEPVCADNVMFFVNMMKVMGPRYGKYVPGYFPDNLTSYRKVADDQVEFVFDEPYSRRWVLMNQLSLITPLPRAWDRTSAGPADASHDLADIPAVYDYLAAQNGGFTDESNDLRTGWPASPIWSVVNGPWKLREYTRDGIVSFVPNEHYSGPNPARLDEFRQVPTLSDEEVYRRLAAGPDSPDGVQMGFLPAGFGATDPFAASYDLVPQDTFCTRFMAINFAHPGLAGRLLRQRYLRQALQHCLDQVGAIAEIYGGTGVAACGPIPLVPPNDLVSPRLRDRNPLAFDVAAAREQLSANGWDVSTTPATCVRPGTGPGCAGAGIEAGDRLSLTVRYAEGRPTLGLLMERFRADAAQAGIELVLEERYASALIGEDHGEAGPDAPHLWQLSCWNGGWVYEYYPTGEPIFMSRASSNWGCFSDPEVDALIDRTVRTDDPEALYVYQDRLARAAPVLWTPNVPLRLMEVVRNLRGWQPINPFALINPENWYYVE